MRLTWPQPAEVHGLHEASEVSELSVLHRPAGDQADYQADTQ